MQPLTREPLLPCSFIVGGLALVGGAAAYYLTLDDPKHEAAKDLSKLKRGAEREIHDLRSGGARSTSEPLGPNEADRASREATRLADNVRYGAEQAKDSLKDGAHSVANAGRDAVDEVKHWGDKLAGDAKSTADRARNAADRATTPSLTDRVRNAADRATPSSSPAGHGFTDEVHRWGDALRSGPSERQAWKPTLDELKRYGQSLKGPDREFGFEQLEKTFNSNGINTSVGGNPYLDWVGPGRSLRRGTMERKLRDLEYEVRPEPSFRARSGLLLSTTFSRG